MADSPTCALCQSEVESIEHLLSTFPVKYIIWFLEACLVLKRGLPVYEIFAENITEEDVIFGKFAVGEDFLSFNHILLLGKFNIYPRKC